MKILFIAVAEQLLILSLTHSNSRSTHFLDNNNFFPSKFSTIKFSKKKIVFVALFIHFAVFAFVFILKFNVFLLDAVDY